MLRRLFLYSLAGLVGAGLTAGAVYIGYEMGWLPLRLKQATPEEQEASRSELTDFLTTDCTGGPLRGALVQKVELVEGRPVITAFVDRNEQTPLLEADAAGFLKEKD